MKPKRLFLLSGAPGSGKSTWAQNQVQLNGGTWISRDLIRFGLITENDDYFSMEDEVFTRFIDSIQTSINSSIETDIYVDATHLNKTGRNRVLKRLDISPLDEINCVCFNVPINILLKRNDNREGLAKVPRSVVRRMHYSFEIPKADEKFTKVIIIDKDGREVIK